VAIAHHGPPNKRISRRTARAPTSPQMGCIGRAKDGLTRSRGRWVASEASRAGASYAHEHFCLEERLFGPLATALVRAEWPVCPSASGGDPCVELMWFWLPAHYGPCRACAQAVSSVIDALQWRHGRIVAGI